ncbi:hypothetical protein HMPREF2946_03775 [Actinomyces sp. HMSC062G12]|nr:hypothetical protein HMPREF2946_03775 [Actinomyces sp. HMSC062G12]
MSQPAPGWYLDPAGSTRLRWWNGGAWTDQFQPVPTQQSFPQSAPHGEAPVPPTNSGASLAEQGVRMPADQQAPAVSSDPYNPVGVSPQFTHARDDFAVEARPGGGGTKRGSKWTIGAVAAWVSVIALTVTSLITAVSYRASGNDLSEAENERNNAQVELDRSKSELEDAQRELQEAQQ